MVYDPNLVITFAGLGDVERVHRQNGRLQYQQAIDLRSVADDQLVKKALAVLGEVKQ